MTHAAWVIIRKLCLFKSCVSHPELKWPWRGTRRWRWPECLRWRSRPSSRRRDRSQSPWGRSVGGRHPLWRTTPSPVFEISGLEQFSARPEKSAQENFQQKLACPIGTLGYFFRRAQTFCTDSELTITDINEQFFASKNRGNKEKSLWATIFDFDQCP